jgi:hypothetical protein
MGLRQPLLSRSGLPGLTTLELAYMDPASALGLCCRRSQKPVTRRYPTFDGWNRVLVLMESAHLTASSHSRPHYGPVLKAGSEDAGLTGSPSSRSGLRNEPSLTGSDASGLFLRVDVYGFCVSGRLILRLLAPYGLGISAAATQRNTFEDLLQNLYEPVEGCLRLMRQVTTAKGNDRVIEIIG